MIKPPERHKVIRDKLFFLSFSFFLPPFLPSPSLLSASLKWITLDNHSFLVHCPWVLSLVSLQSHSGGTGLLSWSGLGLLPPPNSWASYWSPYSKKMQTLIKDPEYSSLTAGHCLDILTRRTEQMVPISSTEGLTLHWQCSCCLWDQKPAHGVNLSPETPWIIVVFTLDSLWSKSRWVQTAVTYSRSLDTLTFYASESEYRGVGSRILLRIEWVYLERNKNVQARNSILAEAVLNLLNDSLLWVKVSSHISPLLENFPRYSG